MTCVCVSSWLKTNSGEPLGPQLFLLHRLVKCNMEIFGRCRGEKHMKGNLSGDNSEGGERREEEGTKQRGGERRLGEERRSAGIKQFSSTCV